MCSHNFGAKFGKLAKYQEKLILSSKLNEKGVLDPTSPKLRYPGCTGYRPICSCYHRWGLYAWITALSITFGCTFHSTYVYNQMHSSPTVTVILVLKPWLPTGLWLVVVNYVTEWLYRPTASSLHLHVLPQLWCQVWKACKVSREACLLVSVRNDVWLR